MARLAQATGIAAGALLRLTFRDVPARTRGLVDADSRDLCPACADEAGTQRAPRLREWACAFTLWCRKHGCRLLGSDMSGTAALGNERLACRGAELLRRWATDADATTPSTAAALKVLLTPYRAPAPPAPWELARLAPARIRERHRELTRRCPRTALSRVVPEYDVAVAIHEQRLPEDVFGLRGARAVERQAVAIGIARLILNPVDAAVAILLGCDDFGRPRVEGCLLGWPIRLRQAVALGLPRAHRKSKGKSVPRHSRYRIGYPP